MTFVVGDFTGINPRFGYENLFRDSDATVSVSSEETDFDKEFAYDWLRWRWWKPTAAGTYWIRCDFTSAKSANYYGFYAHDLGTNGGSIKLQTSTNGSTWTDVADTTVTPTDDAPYYINFEPQSSQYYRFEITSTPLSQFGVISLGTDFEAERGLSPGFSQPKLARDVEYLTTRSKSNILLGRKVKSQLSRFQINLKNLSNTWTESVWLPFMIHLERYGAFFFKWDPINHPNDVCYCEVEDNGIVKPKYQDKIYQTAGLKVVGFVE